VVLFNEPNHASRWANNIKQINIVIAKSLTYVASENSQVTLLNFT